MSTFKQPPWPAHVSLGGYDLMLATDSAGRPIYSESSKALEEYIEQVEEWLDFSGGIGAKTELGNPDAHKSLYFTSSDVGAGKVAGGGLTGAWGGLTPGPALTSWRAVGTNSSDATANTNPVLKLLFFGTKLYAAIGHKLYESADQVFTAATVRYTTGNGAIRDMTVYGGINALPLAYIAQQDGPDVSTPDGVTYTVDGGATGRTMQPKAFLVSMDSGATYTDATNNVSDGAAGTAASLNALPAGAVGHVLIGADRPFVGAGLTIGNANAVATTLTAEYWTGSAWAALTVTSDGTDVAGAKLGATGGIVWARPAATWAKAAVTNLGVAGSQSPNDALYYVRLRWSAILTNPTSITECGLSYQEENYAWAQNGGYLFSVFSGNRIRFTTGGGVTPAWQESADPIMSQHGTVIGLVAANNTAYLFSDTTFAANDLNGKAVAYMPSVFANKLASTHQGLCSWLGQFVYFSADNTLWQFDATIFQGTNVGLERLSLNDSEVQIDRMSALCGDRAHRLFAAGYNATTGHSWLLSWGGYRSALNPQSGIVEQSRLDSWWVETDLGQREIRSMTEAVISGQPYLVMGDDTGNVASIALPRMQSPFDSNSGASFSTTPAYAYLPTFYGPDPNDAIIPFAAGVMGDRLAANRAVVLETSPVGAGSWTVQATFTAAGGVRTALTSPAAFFGVDLRLKVTNNSATAPPVLRGLTLYFKRRLKATKRVITMQVLSDDNVVDLIGRRLPYTADDWDAILDGLVATSAPLAFTRYGGGTENVLPAQRDVAASATVEGRSRRKATTLVLSTAQ